MAQSAKIYTLIGLDGKPYRSNRKGTAGGHKGTKIFGRLDCPAALRTIARGGYVRHRVFFADFVTASKAGYRYHGGRVSRPCLPKARTAAVGEFLRYLGL